MEFCWILLPAGCREAGTAGIVFTQRPKINIFAPHGRLVAPIQVKFGMAEGHVGPLGRAKFQANQWTGWERGPQNGTNFPFHKELPHRGEPFDRFLQLLRALYG